MKNKGDFYIFMAALLWSLGGILLKFVPWSALAANGARNIVSYCFLAIYKKQFKPKINKYVVFAALCLCATNILFVSSNKLTTAANAIVLQYMSPVFVLLYDCAYNHRKPQRYQVLVMLIAFAGMVLFFIDKLGGGYMLGNILAVISGVAFAGVFFINSLPKASGVDATMLGGIFSAVVGIPFYASCEPLPLSGIIAILALGIFQLGMAYVMFTKGIALTNPVASSLICVLEAVMNPIWVYIFWGEAIGKYALAGAAIIIIAVVLNILFSAKANKNAPPETDPAPESGAEHTK
ncbi:MAG: EamA family transporter [Firmicutes bacterium]|nr:EamA family transporter [Bacillota bacterium]